MLRPVTDRTIQRVRALGSEVIDNRDDTKVLPRNRRGFVYGPVPGRLGGVRYIAVHWTGAQYSQHQLRVRTGNPNTPTIPENMSVADEKAIIKFYHTYHQTLDNGVWPGIAYAFVIMPSGRLYVNWNIGTLTYHAFNANAQTVAIALPITTLREPSYPQLVTFFRLLDVLCKETPEIPADHTKVFGHRELHFLDQRNRNTVCAGTVQPHIEHYRRHGTWSVEQPRRGDLVRYFPETDCYLGHGFRAFWEENGGLAIFGYPITNELTDDERECTVQWFERARFEHRPSIANNPHGVVLGLVGREARDGP